MYSENPEDYFYEQYLDRKNVLVLVVANNKGLFIFLLN